MSFTDRVGSTSTFTDAGGSSNSYTDRVGVITSHTDSISGKYVVGVTYDDSGYEYDSVYISYDGEGHIPDLWTDSLGSSNSFTDLIE